MHRAKAFLALLPICLAAAILFIARSHGIPRHPISDAVIVCITIAIIAEQLRARDDSKGRTGSLLNAVRIGGFTLGVIGLIVGGILRL